MTGSSMFDLMPSEARELWIASGPVGGNSSKPFSQAHVHASGSFERSLHPEFEVSVARLFSQMARERASGRRERRRMKPRMLLKTEFY